MRLAVLVAPNGSEQATAAARGEALAWLRAALERLAFEVVVAGVADADADAAAAAPVQLAHALSKVGEKDSVLVHVSGQLAKGALLRAPLARAMRDVDVKALYAELAAVSAESVLVLAELTHDGEADDPLLAAERVAEVRKAIGPLAPGHAALMAVRAEAADDDPLAFTRLVVELGEDGACLSDVVERLRAVSGHQAAAQSFAFRGAGDFTITEVSDAPELAPLLALADAAQGRGEWEQAIAGYRAALAVVPRDADARADLYVRIGAVERARGKMGPARRAFERARAISHGDRASLDALIAIATDAADWPRVVELSRERLPLLEDTSEKRDELFDLARTVAKGMRDIPGAVALLEQARSLDPVHEDTLEALRRSYRVLSRWPELLDVTGALAEIAPTGTERAARRFLQARIALDRLGDLERAFGLLEKALSDDPTHDEALEVLTELRASRGETLELEKTLRCLVGPLGDLGDDERVKDVVHRLAALEHAPAPAESTADESTVERPRASCVDPVEIDAELIADDAPDLHPIVAQPLPMPDDDHAVAALEEMALRAPTDAAVHEQLFVLHQRQGRVDRAYLAALALEELDAIGPEHQAVLDACRPDGLRMRAQVDEHAWPHLRAHGADDVIESLFSAIGRAAIAVHVEDRAAKKKLPSLDPARRQAETSTASIVRTFYWAAYALDVPCPALYLVDDVLGDVAAVPAETPSTAVGPGVLRGLSTKDLAFIAGRHLVYYRPEHAVLIHYPSLPQLTLLVLAAVQLALPAMPVPGKVALTVAALRTRLAAKLTDAERAAMRAAVDRLDARGGKLDLAGWIRSVELTASRVGLLLCGDLRTVMSRLRGEARAIAGVSVRDVRADLLAFCGSSALAELRESVAVTASTPPPPRISGVMAVNDYAAYTAAVAALQGQSREAT